MLDFRIATFLRLCETKSYTKTAKLLNITQPSVTQHIKYLQKRYQCKLFIYEGKTLRLSPEGEYLRRQAEAMTKMSSKVTADLQRMSLQGRTLRFGCPKAIGETDVPRVLAKLMEEDRDLDLELRIENSMDLVNLLESGQLDFILTDELYLKNQFGSVPMDTMKFCGYASPKHAEELYGLSFKRLFRERLLLREEGSADRAVLEQILEQRGFSLRDYSATMVANTPASLQELTAANLGVTFSYDSGMREAVKQKHVQQLYLSDFAEERPLVFMYLKDNLDVERCKPFFKKFQSAWQASMAEEPEM
jgi:DNA-binding transcriptional LysR family regulator